MRLNIKHFMGLRTLPESGSLISEEGKNAQDIVLARGALTSRKGYQKFNTTAFPDAINGLYDYRNRWGKFVMSAIPGSVYADTVLIPDFVATPQTGDINLTVYFMDITEDLNDEITWWEWDFGDGTTLKGSTPDEQYPAHVYTVPGVYSVRLTVGTGSASFTCYKANYIEATGLIPDFLGIPVKGDKPLTVEFFDLTFAKIYTITDWAWTFGDGGTSTEQNPIYIYTEAGQYNVTLQLTTSGASFTRTITKYITVLDPEADPAIITPDFIGVPRTGVKDLLVQFTDKTENPDDVAITYAWTFGDTGTSTDKNPLHVYTACGLYDVSLTVNDGTTDFVTLKEDYILVTQPEVSPDEGGGMGVNIIFPSKWQFMVANYPSIGYSSSAIPDSHTGKVFLAGSVEVGITDTILDCTFSDQNYSSYDHLVIYNFHADNIVHTLIKVPAGKILHLYETNLYGIYPSALLDIFEVDPVSFDIKTVTWNTQPALGDFIESITPVHLSWNEINTGTSGAILIKAHDVSVLKASVFWSMDYTVDKTLRPYISDP